MSCSEVMYQAYYPYLYQRAGAAPPVSAHPVPRTGPFSSPFTAAHQYDRVRIIIIGLDVHRVNCYVLEGYLNKIKIPSNSQYGFRTGLCTV